MLVIPRKYIYVSHKRAYGLRLYGKKWRVDGKEEWLWMLWPRQQTAIRQRDLFSALLGLAKKQTLQIAFAKPLLTYPYSASPSLFSPLYKFFASQSSLRRGLSDYPDFRTIWLMQVGISQTIDRNSRGTRLSSEMNLERTILKSNFEWAPKIGSLNSKHRF